MMKLRNILPILLTAMVFYFAMPEHSSFQHAVADTTTVDADGNQVGCATIPVAKGGVLLGRIIPCIAHTIQVTTGEVSMAMIALFEPLVYAFMTLAITLFGVRVLSGERQLGPQAFIFILKIAFVVGMLEWIPYQSTGPGDPSGGIESVYHMMSDGVTMVTGVLGDGTNTIHCPVADYKDDNTPMLWAQMDCVLGKLYGFTTGSATNADGTKKVNILLGSSVVGLLTGFFFGGTLGAILFFAMIGVLWSIFSTVLKVAMAFLNGYLTACVLLLLAPFFLPLVFLKVTTDYFEKWWKAILGAMLMPSIIAAYAVMAMLMYDKLLFADDSLMQNLFRSDAVQYAQQLPRTVCDFNVTNDPSIKSKANATKAEKDQDFLNPFVQNFNMPTLSGGSDACSSFLVDVFDITRVQGNSKFKNGPEALKTLFHESIKLFIMAWLIGAGLTSVQEYISSFTGSGLSAASMKARSETETHFINKFEDMKQSVFRAVGSNGANEGYKGSQLLKESPQAIKGAAKTILSGTVRK